jgi:hypothetical protein
MFLRNETPGGLILGQGIHRIARVIVNMVVGLGSAPRPHVG